MGSGIFTRKAGELIFHNKIQQSSIDFTRLNIIKRSNRSTKEIIIIGIGESHNLVLSCAMATSNPTHKQTEKGKRNRKEKRRLGKRGRIKRQGWSGGEENKRQMANNVNAREMSLRWVLGMSWLEQTPPRQRRQKSFMLRLELVLVFLEEERVM